MKELKQWLSDGDPVAREPRMSDMDVETMRRALLVEARRQPSPAPFATWPRPLAIGAALAACLALGIGIGLRLGGTSSPVAPPGSIVPAHDVRRQLQMTSPGGTRIIWTFHQELSL